MNRKEQRAERSQRGTVRGQAGASGFEPARLFRAAVAAFNAGRLDDANAALQALVARHAERAEPWHLLGLIAMRRGQYPAALESLRRATACNPGFAEAHSDLGAVMQIEGRLDEAAASYRQALALKPGIAETHCNLGTVLERLGQRTAAAACYRRALEIRPDYANALRNLGAALNAEGDFAGALDSCLHLLALCPDHAEVHSNIGFLLWMLGRPDEAAGYFRRAIAIDPGFAAAHNDFGLMLQEQGRFAAAVACLRRAIAAQPDFVDAHSNLGNAFLGVGRIAEAVACCRRATALRPGFASAESNLLLALNYDAGVTPTQIADAHREWGKAYAAATSQLPPRSAGSCDPAQRLRIGYLSPDFRMHSVSYFAEPLIAAHDRAQVEIFCYANVARPDAVTKRLQSFADGWIDIRGLGDDALAQRIRRERIDILVDLAGHTAGNRLGVFARKPAPVQATWLGYPGTTGLAAVDYRITDAIADPPDEPRQFHSETLLRLPGAFLCFKPSPEAPDVAALPAPRAGRVTFGSFNNLSKLTPGVVALWSRILAAVSDAGPLLKAKYADDPETAMRFRDLFAEQGVAPDRIELAGWAGSTREHLAAYDRVDIALDPFPYNGTTTSCEALWMGVPVVTLRGDRHAGRVGASLLTAIGCPELIAETPDAYATIASALARDLDRLAALRGRLRGRMASSPLCDADGFARAMEAAYRDMWQNWCASQTPA